jgi:hypothetical protein
MAKQIKLSKIADDQSGKAKTKEIIEGIYELFDVITAQYKKEVIDPETNKKN